MLEPEVTGTEKEKEYPPGMSDNVAVGMPSVFDTAVAEASVASTSVVGRLEKSLVVLESQFPREVVLTPRRHEHCYHQQILLAGQL